MDKALSYFREVKAELSRVTWPKRDEVVKLTATVVLISAIVAAYLGVLDYMFASALELLLTR